MKVIIGGAGITGLTLACYLQQNNTEFQILEQSETVSHNRSAIQISSNCHFVFEELGVLNLIKSKSIQEPILNVYANNQLLNKLSVTNNEEEGTLFIRRRDLISILMSKLNDENPIINHKIENVIEHDHDIEIITNQGALKGGLFIDCLGISSLNELNIVDTKSIGIWGISNNTRGLYKKFNNFLLKDKHLVTYPLTNSQTAYTLILNSKKIDISEENLSAETIKNIMPKKYHELIDETEDLVVKRIYESNRINWGTGKVISIGDAAHSITPHLAQGAAQGAIDASFLAKSIKEGKELSLALKQRDSLLKKIKLESHLNKRRFQMGYPLSMLRNLFLRLYKPKYNWLFNSKYES
jgi:salicylate hydroxylase